MSLKNLFCVKTVLDQLKIENSLGIINKLLSVFHGVKYRQESLGCKSETLFINDAKSTNITAKLWLATTPKQPTLNVAKVPKQKTRTRTILKKRKRKQKNQAFCPNVVVASVVAFVATSKEPPVTNAAFAANPKKNLLHRRKNQLPPKNKCPCICGD